jgi:putative addiction module component (TIGR02574 family)
MSTMSSVDDAFAIAQSLAPLDKLELISRIWEDVRVGGEFRPSDSALAEIRRRSAELDAGTVTAIPWEEVRDSVRRRLPPNDQS